jgi:hypothetical protein
MYECIEQRVIKNANKVKNYKKSSKIIELKKMSFEYSLAVHIFFGSKTCSNYFRRYPHGIANSPEKEKK